MLQNSLIDRILVIGPALKMGGMERASVNLVNSLLGKVNSVYFISLFNSEKFFKLNNEIKLIEPIGFNIRRLSIFKTIFWLRKSVKLAEPDLIIVFNKFYGAITLLSLIGLSKKVIISERSSPDYIWPLKLKIINKFIYSILKPDGIMSQTNYAIGMQQKYYGSKVNYKVIPNALSQINRLNYPREKSILVVGRLNDQLKGYDRFFECLKILDLKDWKVIFIGGFLEEDKVLYSKYSNFLNTIKIEFVGQIKDLAEYYNRASIFVIPSRSEGFPNALSEAMAYGMACVSFNFKAGPEDLITDGLNGLLVKDGDIEGLALCVSKLMNNELLRNQMGIESIKSSYQYYGENIANEVLNFCNVIIDKQNNYN